MIQRDQCCTRAYFRPCHFQVKVNLHESDSISFLFFFESYQHSLFSRNRNSKHINNKNTAGICIYRERIAILLHIIEQMMIQQINFQKLLTKEEYFMQPWNEDILKSDYSNSQLGIVQWVSNWIKPETISFTTPDKNYWERWLPIVIELFILLYYNFQWTLGPAVLQREIYFFS